MAFIARWSKKLGVAALAAWTAACGDAGGGSSGTTSGGPGTTGGPGSTGSSGPAVTETGEPTSGSAGQTGSTGTASEGTTAGSSGGVATTTTTTGEMTTGGPGSSGPGGSSSTGDTGGGGGTCEKDADCVLMTDCCTCDVGAIGDTLPACPIMECFAEKCATVTIGAPVCRFGRCTFSKIQCNPAGVTCKSQPPTCGPGEVPSVNEAGDCWTGQCAPIETCDWAPDCAACGTDADPLVCVFKAQKGGYNVCEPKPAGCGDAVEIDCACGQEICDASPPHTVCHDKTPGITCECPFC